MLPLRIGHDPLESCLAEIPKFRANVNMLQQAIAQERDALLDLERTLPLPDHPGYADHEARIKRSADKLDRLEDLLRRVAPELEALLDQCRESEARRPNGEEDRAARESDLRKAIDDPRYWRDGESALARFVSDGFKRLYPDDSEG